MRFSTMRGRLQPPIHRQRNQAGLSLLITGACVLVLGRAGTKLDAHMPDTVEMTAAAEQAGGTGDAARHGPVAAQPRHAGRRGEPARSRGAGLQLW